MRRLAAMVMVLSACAPRPDETTLRALGDMETRLGRMEIEAARTSRFQVVNGTPGLTRNVMLLDTRTGRTWIICETKEADTPTNSNWCAMTQYGRANAPPWLDSLDGRGVLRKYGLEPPADSTRRP